MSVLSSEKANLKSNIKLRVLALSNENDVHFVNSLNGVLSQRIRHIVVRCSHPLHMVAHVEVKVLTSWILDFECLEIAVVVFRLNWDRCISFPLSWDVLMNALFVTTGQKRTFLC